MKNENHNILTSDINLPDMKQIKFTYRKQLNESWSFASIKVAKDTEIKKQFLKNHLRKMGISANYFDNIEEIF